MTSGRWLAAVCRPLVVVPAYFGAALINIAPPAAFGLLTPRHFDRVRDPIAPPAKRSRFQKRVLKKVVYNSFDARPLIHAAMSSCINLSSSVPARPRRLPVVGAFPEFLPPVASPCFPEQPKPRKTKAPSADLSAISELSEMVGATGIEPVTPTMST